MLEDEGALGEDEAGGELQDEEEALHAGWVTDAAGVPVEAAGFVIAEALLLVHAVPVVRAALRVGGRSVTSSHGWSVRRRQMATTLTSRQPASLKAQPWPSQWEPGCGARSRMAQVRPSGACTRVCPCTRSRNDQRSRRHWSTTAGQERPRSLVSTTRVPGGTRAATSSSSPATSSGCGAGASPGR